MKIRTAALIGAGAVGAYVIWGLAETLGENFWVIAEGERAGRLKKNGIEINGRHYDLNVKTPEEAKGADLIIVTVKYGALESAADCAARAAGADTIVISLMNGVDSEEVIGKKIGMEHMLYSIIKIASTHKDGGIEFQPPQGAMGIYIGPCEKIPSTQRLDQKEMTGAVAGLFESSKLNWHTCDNILTQLWAKYAINVSENLPQAVIGVGLGAYVDSEYMCDLLNRLLDEVIALAAHEGIDLPRSMCMLNIGTGVAKNARFSTLQDLDAKKHTEIEMLSGTAVRLGKEWGVPVPVNQVMYDFVRALEEKNDGRFDY